MSTQQEQLSYIERYLIYDIFKYFGPDSTLISHSVECSNGLDGFMSALYMVELNMNISGHHKKETVLVKLMKGSQEFRKNSKAYTQFANEVFVYANILPAYEHLLRSSKLSTDLVSDWVPRAFIAEFGAIKGFSSDSESVLALKHLKNDGYELGPRLVLRRDQLEAMCAVLGPYHAMGYALRILQPHVHDRLKNGVIALPFVTEDASNAPNIYEALYRPAMVRFYEFYDRERQQLLKTDEQEQDKRFAAALERLREKYFAHPVQLLEHIRTASCDPAEPDNYFSTFLHGDFNRNNVLFHYAENGIVDGVKMIDFQELRYSTTAIDLSFFMYMNTPSAERETIFEQLLQKYHKHMYEMLELVLQRNNSAIPEQEIQKVMADYSFELFNAHFKRYAFYGAMICMHFMPWLLSSEDECAKLSHLFETDMHGTEFFQLSLNIGGDMANKEIFKVVRHAFEQGYMDAI